MLIKTLRTLTLLFALSLVPRADERSEIAISWGTFGIADTEELFQVGLEVRLRPVWRDLRPIVGASLLEDGGNHVYIGVRYELNLTERLQLAPSFAPGIYSPGTIDLGGPFEFRSGLDLNYRLADPLRVGAGIYHLSNGGLYSQNGGAEALVFSVSYAF